MDNKITVITAPEEYPHNSNQFKIFLAGTIDSGDSVDWQSQVIEKLKELNEYKVPICIFNPRRQKWPDSTNEIDRQIVWELDKLEQADIIVMNILPTSKSPISLLEFGLYAKAGNLVVFCTDEFYRDRNIFITAEKYHVPVIKSNDINDIVNRIKLSILIQFPSSFI